MQPQSPPPPGADDPGAKRAKELTHDDYRRLRREAQESRRLVQEQVDAFRRDPNRNKYRWI